MTPSEEFQARFRVIERKTDEEGRLLGFRRLRLMERVKLDEWFPDLRERGPVFICASLCEIDSAPVPFARNRAELESVVNRLEEHGVAAGSKAVAKIYGVDEDAGDAPSGERESETETAKK